VPETALVKVMQTIAAATPKNRSPFSAEFLENLRKSGRIREFQVKRGGIVGFGASTDSGEGREAGVVPRLETSLQIASRAR
jgi:hypothetical protein